MLKMVETFSGIGAQAKALANIKRDYGLDFEILKTADWDINAIIAYDFIHNEQKESDYDNMTKIELLNILQPYTLSTDGKKPASQETIERLDISVLRKLCKAIDNSKNLVSVTDIRGEDLPNDMNILTYSFPCQDLSIARAWHGSSGGIDRNANNRSSMLWQIERILKERTEKKLKLPRFLLMENVRNIQSKKHNDNFKKWCKSLEDLGYYNHVYRLNSKDFGIPQNRVRVYMISCLIDKNENLREKINNYFNTHDLTDLSYIKTLNIRNKNLKDLLRVDYSNPLYKHEADVNQIHNTKSRRYICKNNALIYDGNNYIKLVPTITTKQDRHPNSGVIKYSHHVKGKCDFRYLTPRECFVLMGFDEQDFQILLDNNFKYNKKNMFFSDSKLIKMAGNSIVVPVLEEIFKQINFINDNIYPQNK